MSKLFDTESGNNLPDDALPAYAPMLSAYHRSRATELRAIVDLLPVPSGDRVLDLASGDGFWSMLLAERASEVVGVDLSPAYIQAARAHVAQSPHAARINFQLAEVGAVAFPDNTFDLVWCAQSLFSLPDPLAALREMTRVTRPGGYVAILENDSLHHLIMPWPVELELAVRQAQLKGLAARQQARGVDKFYIGRDLAGLLGQAGLTLHDLRTIAVERQAPIDADERFFLSEHLAELRTVAGPFLDDTTRIVLTLLLDSGSELNMLDQPNFHLTHLEMLAVGKKHRG